jgi:hypothetical protein
MYNSSIARFATATFGVRVDHRSSVHLENTVVEANFSGGLSSVNGGYILLNGGAVRENAGHGISLHSGSTATIKGSASIASNVGFGIELEGRSLLSLAASTVTDNDFTGVFVRGGSSVSLNAGATISANQLSGISLMDTSLVHKTRNLADIHITDNGGYGIVCSLPPAVAQIVGFTFQQGNITGNALGNIDCPISPGPKAQ